MTPDLFVQVFCFERKILYNILVGWRFLVCMFSRCLQCSCSTIHVKSANYTRIVCKLHWSSLSGGRVFLPIKWAIFARMLCLSAPFLRLGGLLLLRNSLTDNTLRILLQMGCFCPFLLFVAKLALQVVCGGEKTLHRRCFVSGMALPGVCRGGRLCPVCKIGQSVK